MGFKGSVESFSLADVFQNLAMNQQTGTLRVFTATNEEKHVYFQTGHVRFLSHGAGKPLLTAEIFHARGLINLMQKSTVLRRQEENKEPAAASLMALGYIDEQQFNAVFKLQLEEEIYDLFGWDKANFEFNEGAPADNLYLGQDVAEGPSLPISHLIMEAARRVDEWDRLRKQVPSFKEIYCMDLAARRAIESGEMETDAVETRVASMIDSARDVDDIIQDSALFRFEVLNALSGFIQSSLIRPASVAELAVSEQECLRLDLPKRRIKVLERILALGGENSPVRKELAESLAKDEQIEKACIHFSVLGETSAQAGHEEGAADLYRRILALSPKHIKAHEQLAAIYAKHGKKREAFSHYQELFETFRDQNHLPQARAAAAAAVECDPSHTDLRNSLIELLVADNQKDAAAHQLELMGDHAARAGNVKVAVDAYRRAMLYRANNKGLKKKLADVMLTKEDRFARKRKALLALVAVLLVGLALGALAIKETLNAQAYSSVLLEANALTQAAEVDEAAKRYNEARGKYLSAIDRFASLSKAFSPVLNYNQKAAAQMTRLNDQVREAESNASKYHDELARKAELSRENGDNAMKAKRIFEALELYDSVLSNEAASDKAKAAATSGKADAQLLIDKLKQAKERLAQNPNQAFASVDDEWVYKDRLIADFRGFAEFKVNEVERPLLITPNTDGVLVYEDGKRVGVMNTGAAREDNTFRYSAGEPHKFEFKKAGFKTYLLNTSDLHAPTFALAMEREPAIRVDLRPFMSPEAAPSGEPAFDGNAMYMGTSDGSLLQILNLDSKPTVREFKLPVTGALNNDVYGQVFVLNRGANPKMVIYCTKAGDCFGLEVSDTGFKQVWSHKNTGRDMSAPPSLLRLPLLRDTVVLALPVERRLILLESERGLPVSGGFYDFKEVVTASAFGVNLDSTIVAGFKDGRLRAVSMKTQTLREWTSRADSVPIRSTPAVYENELVSGSDDGNIYLYSMSRNDSSMLSLEGAGPVICEPLVVKRRVYVGSVDKEGFYCGDLVSRQRLWRVAAPDIGDIRYRAATLGESVYFGTDRGKLFSIDADRGGIRWMYQIEGGRPIVAPPIFVGKRLYVISKDGKLLGFDE